MPSLQGVPGAVASLLAIPEEARFHEVVGGELVQKSAPSGEHGDAQAGVVGAIRGPYHRRAGGRWPGGWWIYTEVEILLQPDELYRPDLVGWRRDRVPDRPTGTPIELRPDWICEVISPSDPRNDLVKKMRVYQRCQVPHYWIVDPRDETLSVFRWTPDGYLLAQKAERGEHLRAEPFEAVDLPVGVLFGDDPPD